MMAALFLALQFGDLATFLLGTGRHGIEIESNPILRAIVEQHGGLGAILFKVCAIFFVLLMADAVPTIRPWLLGAGIFVGAAGIAANVATMWMLR